MHLLIPFAFSSSQGCAPALRTLQLPNLTKLLARMTLQAQDQGDPLSLSPPHERALARALGLSAADGQIPWAALQAQSTEGAWGFITPCHWQIGTRHVAMSGASLPDFPEHESRALLAAMQPFFDEDGITLTYEQATCWLARSSVFDGLSTASLDRVAGQQVKDWMPRGEGLATLQRLQAEMQMLLYTHPVNDARAARGVPSVNSFWLSGTGAWQQPAGEPATAPSPTVVATLRDGALNEDWSAWAQAWQTLDAAECATLLATVNRGGKGQLTLCGERNWQTFGAAPQTLARKFMSIFGVQPSSNMLEQL